MKLLEKKINKQYSHSIYMSSKWKVTILNTNCIKVFKALKARGNSWGYTVTKVYIYWNNKSFRIIVRWWDIYSLGRTVYYKAGRKIPCYLTGL